MKPHFKMMRGYALRKGMRIAGNACHGVTDLPLLITNVVDGVACVDVPIFDASSNLHSGALKMNFEIEAQTYYLVEVHP